MRFRATATAGGAAATPENRSRDSFVSGAANPIACWGHLVPVIVAGFSWVGVGHAQRPDSTKADSAARARADSIALVRELERQAPPGPAGQQPGPTNPRLLPDISVVGDILADASSKRSFGGQRFLVREVELGLQAAVDPYFRGTVFLGFNDEEGVAIEEAFVTTSSIPFGLEGRVGRFRMPFGKLNLVHPHDLHTVEYPHAIQRFFSEEGLKGTGLYLSKIFSPLGFYQELQLTAVERIGEAPEGLLAEEPPSASLGGLGYSVRLRNYVDVNESTNLEISASALTGRREQPVELAAGTPPDINAVNARQSLLGLDVTVRWRPLQQGLYRSLIVQGELLLQNNERDPTLRFPAVGYLGPTRNFSGGYLFGRYQLTRRTYVGGRYDQLEDPEADGERLRAVSGYFQFYPSEFSKLLVGYERLSLRGAPTRGRLLMQATFALGPHKPHPF